MSSPTRGFARCGRPLLGALGSAIVTALAATAVAEDLEPKTSGENASALVARVSAAYAYSMRGVVAVHTRTDLTVDGPMLHEHTPSSPWYVYADEQLVSSSEPPDPRRPLVRDAMRPLYLPEYRYAFADCTGCSPGEIEIAYESPEHDAYHAHGWFVIATASERVQRSVEIPYRLAWPTHDGRLEVTWGATAANEWLPLRVAGTFVGKMGPFTGTAHYTQMLFRYERYARVEAAVAALTTETGATPAPTAPPASH